LKSTFVRKLAREDLDFAFEMTVAEQWNDRPEDIKRVFDFEPKGCFIAEVDNKPAGHVFAITYGKLGWIGLLIVKTEHRRMGIGRLLMTKAEEYLLSRDVETVKLEAVPEISDLYRKLGFVEEYDSFRYVGTTERGRPSKDSSIVSIKETDIASLADFDARFFGAPRNRVLAKLCHEYPELCLVSRSGSRIDGYVMCRKALSGYKLGPWVCDPEKSEIAEELLVQCTAKLEPKSQVYIGVPAPNHFALGILERLGYSKCSHSIRMRFGKKLENECVEGVFAIGGPTKG
jgi:ribosomal protein S18 acetylase RimI-like enzyme